ncbi:MAG: ferritin-like domain-containing protein, partial [Pseudomonadota bacterium]
SEMVGHANLEEWQSPKDTGDMISSLIADHETCATKMRDLIEMAEAENDHVTADLLTERIAFHEKAVWMLKALNAK